MQIVETQRIVGQWYWYQYQVSPPPSHLTGGIQNTWNSCIVIIKALDSLGDAANHLYIHICTCEPCGTYLPIAVCEPWTMQAPHPHIWQGQSQTPETWGVMLQNTHLQIHMDMDMRNMWELVTTYGLWALDHTTISTPSHPAEAIQNTTMWNLSTYCCVWALDHVGVNPLLWQGDPKYLKRNMRELVTTCGLQALWHACCRHHTLTSDMVDQKHLKRLCWVLIKVLDSLRDVAKHSSPNASIPIWFFFHVWYLPAWEVLLYICMYILHWDRIITWGPTIIDNFEALDHEVTSGLQSCAATSGLQSCVFYQNLPLINPPFRPYPLTLGLYHIISPEHTIDEIMTYTVLTSSLHPLCLVWSSKLKLPKPIIDHPTPWTLPLDPWTLPHALT